MPYTKQALETLHSISMNEVDETLIASLLPIDREEYTDEEIQSSFNVVRDYLTNGKASNFEQAAEMFKQNTSASQPPELDSQSKSRKSKNGKKAPITKSLDISELLALASEQAGTRISLIEASKILDACGLPDQEQYTDAECDRFLAACDLVKKQGKSYESVAASFRDDGTEVDSDPIQQVEHVIGAIENQASSVTNELLQERAESQALTDAQKYMLHYAKAATEGQQVQEFWAKLRDHARARLGGKSQARLIRAEPETTLILSPSPNSTNSCENSENGTTED